MNTTVSTDVSTEDGSSTRRRLFQALGLGGTIAAIAASRSAAAADAPPKRPTADDVELLKFAVSVELAAVAAYDAAWANDLAADEATTGVLEVIRDHHVQYANAVSALIGSGAPKTADPAVVQAVADGFTGDLAATLTAAQSLEDAASQTHLSLLGVLTGTDAAALVASIAMMEGRHATALAIKTGEGALFDASGLQPTDAAFSPAPANA